MPCLQLLEEITNLLVKSSTVRWYEVEVDAVMRSANAIVFNENMVSRLSAIYASCTFALANPCHHESVPRASCSRAVLVVQNLEEQLFILKVMIG
jgi:hypothetical protein